MKANQTFETPLPREGSGVGSAPKVVVAFSGGLDTSYTVMRLANTGGFSQEQLKKNEENAYRLGAKHYVTLDVTQEYYEKSLRYMIFGNVLRNNCYPISVSSERIFQAIAIARYANEVGADAIAHGSTGAGNDQIRFDMTFLVMAPATRNCREKTKLTISTPTASTPISPS